MLREGRRRAASRRPPALTDPLASLRDAPSHPGLFPAAVLPGGRRATPGRPGRRGWRGVGFGGFLKGGRPAGKSGMSLRKASDRGCRVPFSSLGDPVPAGSRPPEPETAVGKPLGRPAAPRRRLALPAPARRPPPSGPASPSQARPPPRPARGGNYGGGSRTRAGGKAHGECLGVSPNAAGGDREEEMNLTARENHPDSQPGGRLQM